MNENKHQRAQKIKQKASSLLYQFTQIETIDFRIAVAKEILRRLEFEKSSAEKK